MQWQVGPDELDQVFDTEVGERLDAVNAGQGFRR
jgi:hypothetical protein